MVRRNRLTVIPFVLAGLGAALAAPNAFADRPRCVGVEAVVEASTPTDRFEISDSLVTDKSTKLMWARCPVGYSYDGSCSLTPLVAATFGWKDAIAKAEDPAGNSTGVYLGKSGWRVPNLKELASIIEHGCFSPAINNIVFPGTPPGNFWTNSALRKELNVELKAWVIDFGEGKAAPADASYAIKGQDLSGQPLRVPSNSLYLRLVRDAD